MLVRPLRPQDLDNTMIMMDYYREEMDIGQDEEWNENSVIQSIRLYSTNAECMFLVAVESDRVVGCCSGIARKEFYNDTIETVMQMMFLLPSHRNKENYQQLLGEFLNWSHLVKSQRMLLVDIGNSNTRIQTIADTLNFDHKNIRVFVKEIE